MSVCYAAVTGIKSGGSNEAGYNSVKVTSVSAKALSFYVSLEETASFFVIVFGKQLQWGYTAYSESGYVTVNFPISFASSSYIVMRTNITDSTGNLSPRSLGYKSKTNSSVQMYATSITGINYLVAGKQKQWGEATTNTTTNFPISFAEAAYCVLGVPCGSGGTDNFILQNFDKISVTFSMWKYTGKCYFIAVGL